MTEEGKFLIRKYEGCSLIAYKCPAGKWTIGYGSTFYADGSPVKEGDKIDFATANKMFEKVVESFEKEVRFLLGSTLCCTLPAKAIDALVSFAYNVGTGAFSKSTLLRKIKADKNDFEGIEKEFMKWTKGGGKVFKGLERRRAEESKMYIEAVLEQYSRM